MKFSSLISLSLLSTIASAITPIEVKGNAFWLQGTSTRFYIRGLDYQPGGSSQLEDPLADTDVCTRDVEYFKELGINTVRVYSIDNTRNHDECMQKLSDAGIYVVIDVNTPYSSITRQNASCSYNTDYLQEVFASVQEFAKYDNTLGFFAGNEVINDADSLDAAPYVKAVVRDIKTFLKNRNLRTIPVGYSAASVVEYRLPAALYFNCGDDELARIDMYGINDYSWCGDASMTTSQYSIEMSDFANYTVPIFFSEFGCNTVRPRPFTEIEVIYSTQMSSVFSGGLVYEYSNEANDYGLVELDGSKVTKLQDFTNLKDQLAKYPDPSGDGDYNSNGSANNCPAKNSDWDVSEDIPDTPAGALKYLSAVALPTGHGFDAYVQQACNDPDNTVDDSGKYSSTVSNESAGSGSGATSTEKKQNDAGVGGQANGFLVGLAGILAGLSLL
ncbi:gel1 [[Candida] subhashii]|uniref:1,3-beta-glucanosyltransferase n=1 Tax=[Candida] subhashii TaxID=561895 RepID=A0A8J5QRW9_9ASCO|nr:gel1 [[Candida] subhashii]KAG7664177.1 gel1 [[Candida] subhashii]